MKIHRITDTVPAGMEAALAEFERCFVYPLGPNDSFTIAHGPDYIRFFRSMGDACVYVAESSGEIAGVLAVVRRTVTLVDGTRILAAYFCDAKVAPKKQGSPVLARLALMAQRDLMEAGVTAAFSIVMEGSPSPETYTGRIGIPLFRKLEGIQIARLETSRRIDDGSFDFDGDYTSSGIFLSGGDAATASQLKPVGIEVDGARGTLLDTRRGKSLWRSDGVEMISGHLSAIQADSPASLVRLVNHALEVASRAGFPGLFIGLPGDVVFKGSGATLAGANVYGTGLPEGRWMINTGEI
jgi:hypothetical protein